MQVTTEVLNTTALLACWLFGVLNAPPWMAGTSALTTNAIKHGAWVAPEGEVAVTWHLDKAGDLQLRWVERGGPRAQAPARTGFGHVVIERMVAVSVGGRVDMAFAPEGLRWMLSVPRANLADVEAFSRGDAPLGR
jgi:hypothetical protein